MDSLAKSDQKPHVVCIPYPAQSHIKAMLKLAKILHSRGILITFVNTEFNHKRFLKTRGPKSLQGSPGFRFETIPDGLPPSDADATQDIHALSESVRKTCLAPFQDLVVKLNGAADGHGFPPVTSIVSDGFMTFTIDAAESLGIPIVLFWTISAGSFMGCYQFQNLLEKGFTPLKDESYLTNGYLDTIIDWIPGMKGIRLRDLPSFFQTTDQNDFMFNFIREATQRASKATGNIINTFDALEEELVKILSSMFPNVYTIGPQQLLLNRISSSEEEDVKLIGYSLWKEDTECLKWLDSKQINSVVYVNFGSITALSQQQLVEFGWGLAKSDHNFLWIIRPDLVAGESAVLGSEFMEVTKERGFIASWCPQEEVLNHDSVGGFLTHGGWNSIIESLSAGVPMICWPFFADQTTNCRYMCNEWDCGMEIARDVKRDGVEKSCKRIDAWREGEENEEQGHGVEEIGRGCLWCLWIIFYEFRQVGFSVKKLNYLL